MRTPPSPAPRSTTTRSPASPARCCCTWGSGGCGRSPRPWWRAAARHQGRPGTEPVALVRWGTTARQETLTGTLADIADTVDAAGFANPAIIVVGAVAALREQLRWYDTRPLHGLSVLVPRTRQQASALSDRLRALGAEPVEAPTIAIEPGREPERLRAELAAAADGAYDWMALTSVNGVDAVFAAIAAMGADARLLA